MRSRLFSIQFYYANKVAVAKPKGGSLYRNIITKWK